MRQNNDLVNQDAMRSELEALEERAWAAGTGIGFNSLNRLVQNNAIAQRLGYGPTDIPKTLTEWH